MKQHDVFVDRNDPGHGALALRCATLDRLGWNDDRILVISKHSVSPHSVRRRELGERAYRAEVAVR